ncbi:unnamed protein product [Notodromas monacha]|uniref:Uncharacterized protein n=1 Tax=Notodromas monacha TaxID=399045 RepID=A0A7R9C291_9CRUS|nr:unnamed protein product [Notodromas monacha]CAG0924453.1 unnamed protein product [Notodromas monacha]
MIMADEDFGLRDDGASWHWYLLWGSLLFGTLAALGSGAPYAQILLKSQVVDKFKPMFGGHDKELAPFEEEIMSLKDQFKPEMLEKGYQWCQDRGLVAQACSNCNTKLELSTKIKDNTCVGYCPNCQSTCDPLAGTWFEECELDPWASIAILFYWAVGYTYPQAASRIQVSPSIARAAYAKCVKFSEKALALCKDELYLDVPTKHYETHQHQACPQFKIGGKGKKVEVAVVGKNQLVKDNFAIIGAEVGSWRCFVLPSSIINKTLVDFAMHQRVREGSIVYHPLSLYHGGDRTQYLPQTFMPQGTAVASTEDRKVSVEHVDKVRDEMRANVPELLSAWDYYVFVVQYMYNKKFWFSPSESFRRILEHIAEVYNNSPEMTA